MSMIRLLVKPTIFTFGVCGTCFCTAAIIQHSKQRSWPTRSYALPQYKNLHTGQQRSSLEQIREIRRNINAFKESLSTSQKLAFGTIFINLVVLGAWRLRAFRHVMGKYFISKVSTSRIALSPLILSCFSHRGTFHLALNMYALWSFSEILNFLLGPEQLVGLFISAGAVSSLTSIGYRLLTGQFIPSLGASGAVCGVIAYYCVKEPNVELELLFLLPLTAGSAIKGLMLFDTVGVIARLSILDHAAHLGGSLFGVWYALYGEDLFHKNGKKLANKWRELWE